ncbi:DUF5312 family protein [Treponema sp.]|uniref:DUF5312 family protein n=1 Tax=Treponema sp. TaxID=166 RepID=UPI00298D74EE|nr:DUF5312 family protein [Treponema sp.]MCQ2240978.1 DUF5312 family protein [Treponema sp.]
MGGNFLKDLLGSFFGGSDPEAQKKKVLKSIAKSLSKTKYKFYKMGSNEVDPSFAKFMFELYKAVSPAQAMIQSFENPNALKRLVLNRSLTEKQIEALDNISETAITELARKQPLKAVNEIVRGHMETFTSAYDSSRIARTDALYTKLMYFANFVQFDFYFTLKKFDNTIKEHEFTSVPKFSAINGSYIVEDLKNFIDVAWVLPFDTDWSDVFKLIKSTKGADPLPMGTWKKILARVKYLRDNHIIEMLIQLISENPLYRDEYMPKELYIVDDYIADIKKAADNTLEELQAKQTAGKVDGLLVQIFGTNEVEHLKYYNEAGSAPFERKGIGSFAYSEPLGYLKQFILDYIKKDIRELNDILTVRGEWANQQLATPMSDAFHSLVDISADITALDNSVNETVDLGLKMKTHLPRADRDKDSKGIIQSTLNQVNDTAGRQIKKAINLLISYDRNLKMILEDCVKKHQELILNWNDIDHFAEGQLKQMSIDAYKKIFAFVSLMQNFPIELTDEDE